MPDYQKIRDQLKAERDKGSFIFLPSPILDKEICFYMPVVEIVKLREDEIYEASKKFRVHYNGLMRLSQAAAMEWSAKDTCRTDGRTDKMYCSFRAVGGVRKADGKIYFHKAEKDIDLEIIEMELEDQYTNTWNNIGDHEKVQWKKKGHKTIDTYVPAMVRRDLIQKRKNKLMFVESGAKARIIRFVLGLQNQYSNKKDVLGINFVMVHYALNPNHPEVKGALLQSLPGSMNMIYGGASVESGQIPYVPESQVIDITESTDDDSESEKDKFDIFDIRELQGFQSLSGDDQEKWLRHFVKKLNFEWDAYTESFEGKDILEVPQACRDEFFTYILKTYNMKNKEA